MVREILKMGNPQLYEISKEITKADKHDLPHWINDLHDTLIDYRRIYGAGRAIAAPQIGVQKRLLYMFIDRPFAFINPVISFPDHEKFTLSDTSNCGSRCSRRLPVCGGVEG